MPKTSRGSRNVFGDVSNNRQARRHTAITTKKSGTSSNSRPQGDDVHPRRSSRLSLGVQSNEAAADSKISTNNRRSRASKPKEDPTRSSRMPRESQTSSVASSAVAESKPAAKESKSVMKDEAENKKCDVQQPRRSSRFSIVEEISSKASVAVADSNDHTGKTTSAIANSEKPAGQPRRSSRLSLGDGATTAPGISAMGARKATSRGRSRATTHTNNDESDEPSKKGKQLGKRNGDPSGDGANGKGKSSKRSRDTETSETRTKKVARKRTTSTAPRSKSGEPQAKKAPPIAMSGPCCDFLRATDYCMVREPFDPSKYTYGVAPHDIVNKNDVNHVTEYVTDIFQRYYDTEKRTHPSPYMHNQPKLNSTMRAILIDWIVEVHMKFRLLPESLYLCVNIIDRFLSCSKVERNRLQLVGVTSLLLACKYEEIYPPEVRDCVYICDKAYTRQDVLDMEAAITKALRFTLSVPTGHHFLQRYIFLTKASPLQAIAANYYMERMLQEYSVIKYKPSLIAAAALTLALNHEEIRTFEVIRETKPGVPKTLLEYTRYSQESILEVSEKISSKVSDNVVTVSRRELEAVKRKYEMSKYTRISTDFYAPRVSEIPK